MERMLTIHTFRRDIRSTGSPSRSMRIQNRQRGSGRRRSLISKPSSTSTEIWLRHSSCRSSCSADRMPGSHPVRSCQRPSLISQCSSTRHSLEPDSSRLLQASLSSPRTRGTRQTMQIRRQILLSILLPAGRQLFLGQRCRQLPQRKTQDVLF